MTHDHRPDELEDHDKGLSHDLPKLVRRGLGRRGMLGVVGGLGVATLAGCALGDNDSSASGSTPSSQGAPPGGPGGGGGPGGAIGGDSDVEVADGEIPEETAGPFPGDGSNGPNVLTESGIVRSDITSSFGSASGVAEGVPLTVKLKVYDLAGEDATALAGAAIYLWHCDREGRYSMYDEEIADENYLRGVQEADADGRVEFTTIFPAAYSGRWPHIHFEVYPSLAEATSAENKLPHLAARLPRGRLHRGVRDRRVRGERHQPGPDEPRDRRGLLRRLLPPARRRDRLGRRRLRRHPERPGLNRAAPLPVST